MNTFLYTRRCANGINRCSVSATHSYQLSDDQPVCSVCQYPLTVKHFLIECVNFAVIRSKHFNVSSTKDVFKNVDELSVVDFIQEFHFFCRAMLCISAAYAALRDVCLSVCLSRSCSLSKRINIIYLHFFHRRVATLF